MRPVKPATQVAPKWWALSMQSFQPCKRLAVHLLVFERIAEHAEGRDRDVAIADGVEAALAEFAEVLAIGGLPEERLETLEAEIGDGRDVFRRAALGGLDHGADADGFGGVGHDSS